MPSNGGYAGFLEASTSGSDFAVLDFIIGARLARVNTATLVKVQAVTNTGGVAAVGFVDVQPLVNLIDADGNAYGHGTVYHLPYSRLQGGANAIILDPQVGDIGVAVFCDRDISSVKQNKTASNPGSRRRFDMADGVYLGGVLNGVPTQYVQFSDAGITLDSPTAIALDAPQVTLSAPQVTIAASTGLTITTPTVNLSGALVATGEVTANGKALSTHVHTGVTSGSSNTGPPA